MLPLRESNRLRRFPFELDRFRRSGLVENRYFVAVLVAALVDDFLHLRGRVFRKRERPDASWPAAGPAFCHSPLKATPDPPESAATPGSGGLASSALLLPPQPRRV